MRKTAAVTTALALMATPAFAQGQGQGGQGQGQSTSPAKICAKQFGSDAAVAAAKRKVPGTKGQSAWAGCVSGVKKQNADRQQGKTQENPARRCKAITPALSKKKAPGQKKSPYGACVSGYAKAQNDSNQS